MSKQFASHADSERHNARLILLLANHIGDQQVPEKPLAIAAQGTEADPTQQSSAPQAMCWKRIDP